MAAKSSARRRNAPAGGPRSESAEWGKVGGLVEQAIAELGAELTRGLSATEAARVVKVKRAIRRHLDEINAIAIDMERQVSRGVHRNSPLTVFSLANPPRGGTLMSDHLFTIEYQHKANGKNYYHDFKRGTMLHAMPDGTLRISRPGANMWKDLPAE